MKPKIHPEYHSKSKVSCASCGNKFVIGSTMAEIHTEICANCHPFYTGKQVLIDTAGRVERFQKIIKKTGERQAAIVAQKATRPKPKDIKTTKTSAKTAKTSLKKIKAGMNKQ